MLQTIFNRNLSINELDIGKKLIDAAIDSNMVVYDHKSKGDFTNRLLMLMNHIIRKNSGCYRLTDVFFRETEIEFFPNVNLSIRMHPMDSILWDSLEDYYTKELDGCFASGDNNLVIGVSVENGGDFRIDGSAIIIQDNKRLILGSF